MEKIVKLIRKESLPGLYAHFMEKCKVYAPVRSSSGKIEFRYNPEFPDVTFDHIRSVLSVKNLVFPKVENLMYFSDSKTETRFDAVDPERMPDVVLWGAHPCDTAAFDVLKSVFCWDIKDDYFANRLEKLTVVGLACSSHDNYCFCTSVGLSPSSEKGSDILLTPLKNGDFKADILTAKGEKVLNEQPALFESYSSEEAVVTVVEKKFSHEEVTARLEKNFEHPFWVENSLRCLGCGACAFVCPTCACFDIQDEKSGSSGRRYRCWDSCGFKQFTLHTSGHNPRPVQSKRWRQRIMHKFSYMPDRNNSLGCVGCGRCSAACPADMNISEQLETLQSI